MSDWYQEFDRKMRLRKPSWGPRLAMVSGGLSMALWSLAISQIVVHPAPQFDLAVAGALFATAGVIFRIHQLRAWKRRVQDNEVKAK